MHHRASALALERRQPSISMLLVTSSEGATSAPPVGSVYDALPIASGFAGLILAVSGCGTAGLSGYLMDFGRNRITFSEIEQHRANFARERDPASFRWLLMFMKLSSS